MTGVVDDKSMIKGGKEDDFEEVNPITYTMADFNAPGAINVNGTIEDEIGRSTTPIEDLFKREQKPILMYV